MVKFMNEEKILGKCDSMHMLDEAITDHDTFKQVSDKHNGKTVITFRVPRSKILAVAKMINRAMADGWELDTQLITDADKSLYFACSLSK